MSRLLDLVFGESWKGWFDSSRMRCIASGISIVLFQEGLGLDTVTATTLAGLFGGAAVCDTFRKALPK